jgi:hypothetical protein
MGNRKVGLAWFIVSEPMERYFISTNKISSMKINKTNPSFEATEK